jgi:hypothetical protein
MVGHRSERYAQFGSPAARLDDLLSWPAARLSVALTVLSAPVVGGSPQAVARITRRDGGRHPSPNAGQIEAAFAAALGVRLGGPLAYAGAVEHRPHLGEGEPPQIADIRRAARLSLAVGTAGAALGAAVASGRAVALSGRPGTMGRRAARVPGAAAPAGTAGRGAAPAGARAARALRPVPARCRHLVVTCAALSGKSDHAPPSAPPTRMRRSDQPRARP